MASKPAPGKILRIGIIQSGKIIEERLLRSQQAVTIGQSPKNTFVIPVSNLPRSATLFDVKRGNYTLAFKDNMDGRVSLEDQGVMDFASLKSKGVAKKSGDSWNVALTDKSRGKVVLGDVTLLFQFVTPPPPAPKLQLPAAAKGGWVKSIEWHFVTILIISAFLQGGPTMFLVLKDWPEIDPKTAKIPDRFIDLMVPDRADVPPEEETPTDTATEETGDEKVEKKKVERKVERKVEKVQEKKVAAKPEDAETRARRAAARKRELARKVQNNSLLKFIGAKGAGGGARSVADALAGGAARSKIDEAFNGATGVATAEVGQDRSRRGAGAAGDAGGEAVGIGDLKSKRTSAKVSTGAKKKEVKVRARVSTKGPSSTIGTGKLAKSAIAAVVKRRIRAVQACYERELKKDPSLAGKVTIQFTIGTVGRITSAKITVNTTKSAAVGNCIKQRIKMWRFPKPEGGAVTVAYPFVFTASK